MRLVQIAMPGGRSIRIGRVQGDEVLVFPEGAGDMVALVQAASERNLPLDVLVEEWLAAGERTVFSLAELDVAPHPALPHLAVPIHALEVLCAGSCGCDGG